MVYVSVKKILKVEEVMPGHFYWPDLEVDLSLEVIEIEGWPGLFGQAEAIYKWRIRVFNGTTQNIEERV